MMSRTHDHTRTGHTANKNESPATTEHTIGEGSAIEKSGGPSDTGDLSGHGTTPGTAEGKEADIDEALQQQGHQAKPKPR
jgi:hypothetical protein